MKKKLRTKKIVKRIAEKGKDVFVEKKENETVKAGIRESILNAINYDRNVEKILGKYKFSIKELEQLRVKFAK